MKTIKFGNILDAESGIIMHGCNDLGVMGSGIALAVKEKYPACFQEYSNWCIEERKAGKELLGNICPFSVPYKDLVIANCITQSGFGKDSKRYVSYKAIQSVFQTIAVIGAGRVGVDTLTIHYPLIGAGLGGGDWAIISEIIETVFAPFPEINRTLWIYE